MTCAVADAVVAFAEIACFTFIRRHGHRYRTTRDGTAHRCLKRKEGRDCPGRNLTGGFPLFSLHLCVSVCFHPLVLAEREGSSRP